eukprot:scaffold111327_cov26-Tisochrysis_lutea.AAC.1
MCPALHLSTCTALCLASLPLYLSCHIPCIAPHRMLYTLPPACSRCLSYRLRLKGAWEQPWTAVCAHQPALRHA